MTNDSLTYEQKLAVLTGGKDAGADKIVFCERVYEEMTGFAFPSGLLADSGDADLAGKLVELVATKARENGAVAMVLPSLAPVTKPGDKGAAEDNFMIAAIAAAEAQGARAAGVEPIIADFGLKANMYTGDKSYDEKAVADRFIKPLLMLKVNGKLPAIAYKATDDERFGLSRLINAAVGKPKYELCVDAVGGETVRELKKGRRVLSGDEAFARNAYLEWAEHEKQLRRGLISEAEMHALNQKDEFLSAEAIDAVFGASEEFIAECAALTPLVTATTEADVFKRLSEQSAVMLKNSDRVLPLTARLRAAVVGNCAADGLIEALDSVAATSRFDGYDAESDEIILTGDDELAEIAKNDVIIYLIDNARGQGKPAALPPNRLVVLDKLRSTGKKIIAVAVGDNPIDASFCDKADGVLLARGNCPGLGRALAGIIAGRVNPSGRLAVTLYDDSEAFYRSIRRDEAMTKTKCGVFFGYKYYDGSGANVRYPFGYGLSYQTCAYSIIKAEASQIQLRVTNGGGLPLSEVVRVYAGCPGADAPRARKELVALSRIRIQPHETVTVRIPVSESAFCGYSAGVKRFVTERGDYTIYVGSQVTDESKRAAIKVYGEKPIEIAKQATEVLPWKPNITSDGYSMEEGENLMKNSKKLSIIAWVLLIATLLTDVAVAVLWITNELPLYFYEVWFTLVVSALVFNHIILIIAVAILANVKKRNRDVEKLLENVKTQKFADATVLKNDDASSIFKTIVVPEEIEEQARAAAADESFFSFDFDKSLRFTSVCSGLRTYLSERGYLLGADEVRSLVASFASSRLLLVPDKGCRKAALTTAAEFLGSEPFYLSLKADPDAVFCDETFVKAIEYASASPDEPVFCFFEDVTAAKLNAALVKLLAYLSSPEKGREIYYENGGAEARVVLPPNLWLVAVLSGDAAISRISREILSHAAMLFIKVDEKETDENITPFAKIGYNQFVTMVSVAKDRCGVDEEAWKRVDRLEHALAAYSFKLDNKDWQVMETFAATFIESDGDALAMIDYLVAERIVPVMADCAEAAQKDDKSLKDMVELACGEENIDKIISALKEVEAAPREEVEAPEPDETAEAPETEAPETEAAPETEFAPVEENVDASVEEDVAPNKESADVQVEETAAPIEANEPETPVIDNAAVDPESETTAVTKEAVAASAPEAPTAAEKTVIPETTVPETTIPEAAAPKKTAPKKTAAAYDDDIAAFLDKLRTAGDNGNADKNTDKRGE